MTSSFLQPVTVVAASVAALFVAVVTSIVEQSIRIAEGGEDCTYCKGSLPGGREISFCPHCGQDLTLVHCPACGSGLERGWKFCATCGRASTEV